MFAFFCADPRDLKENIKFSNVDLTKFSAGKSYYRNKFVEKDVDLGRILKF